MKSSSVFRQKRRIHPAVWVVIGLVVALVGGGAGYAAYLSARVHKSVPYVKTWSQADNQQNVSQAQQGLSELDAGHFPSGNFATYPIIQVAQKDPDVENILVVGLDRTQGDGTEGDYGSNRADSILVMSADRKTNTLKMVSLLRDTKTYFPNTKSKHKLNAAYSYGGIGLQIDVINYAYKLDIQKYVQFDFDGFSHIIDVIGGVPMQLTQKEAVAVGVGQTAGTYQLDGAHALLYARTREIDTEFQRTQRQRNIVMAIYRKFRTVGLMTKLSMLNTCTGYFKTNIPSIELTGDLLKFESSLTDIKQLSIPSENDGMYTTEEHPVWYWDLNWTAEVQKLQKFLYPAT